VSEGLGDIDGVIYRGVCPLQMSDGDAGRAEVEEEEEGGEEEEEEGADREGSTTFRNLFSLGETKRWMSSPDIEEGTTYIERESDG
jgi:hypothetical protein